MSVELTEEEALEIMNRALYLVSGWYVHAVRRADMQTVDRNQALWHEDRMKIGQTAMRDAKAIIEYEKRTGQKTNLATEFMGTKQAEEKISKQVERL